MSMGMYVCVCLPPFSLKFDKVESIFCEMLSHKLTNSIYYQVTNLLVTSSFALYVFLRKTLYNMFLFSQITHTCNVPQSSEQKILHLYSDVSILNSQNIILNVMTHNNMT